MLPIAAFAILFAVSCANPARPPSVVSSPTRADTLTLSIVGTNDLHGRLHALPLLSGYVANIRKQRAAGGDVLLVDAGDMFQGTVESNLNEGLAVIKAYNAIGYKAAAIGNHEFDFGPVGEKATPQAPDDDPRGALKARAKDAAFPFLSANLLDESSQKRVDWENVLATTLVTVGGLRVGIVGVITAETPRKTIAANFLGLKVGGLAEAVAQNARTLRTKGAALIVVTAHAGGDCTKFENPADLSSCDQDEEIFEVARALPKHLVDVIVAGHTHEGVAHEVNGIPIVESYAWGQAFSRVDLTLDRRTGKPLHAKMFPPRFLCETHQEPTSDCLPGSYEGYPVQRDRAIQDVLEPYFKSTEQLRDQSLGVIVDAPFARIRVKESALGNLVADLIRSAHPEADVALMNGGGLRAEIPVGEFSYGDLYRVFPFDNRFAIVRLKAAELARVVAGTLARKDGFLYMAGVRAVGECRKGKIEVTLTWGDGRPIDPKEELVIATSDFLATGGDRLFDGIDLTSRVHNDQTGLKIRDGMAAVLKARGGHLNPHSPSIFDASRPRVSYPGARPVQCH